MLKHLYVKNFILIDQTDLDFNRGFSAFTGETGAGKSILIDAINLLCGQRAQAGLVKQGTDKAIIEGVFDFSNNTKVISLLQDANFEIEEEVVITREITVEGKSQFRLNHRAVTASLVKECLSHEIDIHSQHDTQYLLNRNSFLNLLDQYIKAYELLNEVKQKYQTYHELQFKLEEALKPQKDHDLEFLQFQLDEIDQARLIEGEDEELEEKEKLISSYEKIYQKVSDTIEILEGSQGATQQLYQASHLLASLSQQKELAVIHDSLLDQYYAITDTTERLKQYFETIELSEQEINEVQSRLYEINRLKRKYGRQIPDILAKRAEIFELIDQQQHHQEYLDSLTTQVAEAKTSFEEVALRLRVVRQEKSVLLQQEIEHHLHDLMLPHARFILQLNPGIASKRGLDEVDFLISMNLGEPPRSLIQVASGGELSRLMLGLKTIFTHLQGIQTVIFDEIDTGVSGQVATAIGLKMNLLARDAQVFSVTHLAQVAACANQHYHVSKKQVEQRTDTIILKLSEQERIEQLALISSGECSVAAKQAAEELYKRNQAKAKQA